MEGEREREGQAEVDRGSSVLLLLGKAAEGKRMKGGGRGRKKKRNEIKKRKGHELLPEATWRTKKED